MSLPLDVTLNYGDCYYDLTEINRDNNNTFTLNYDNYDYTAKSGYKHLDFHIKQIFYSEKNGYVESLKIIYKNKKTGKLISLLDTPEPENTKLIQNIEIKELEEIINVKIWLKKKTLTGFEIKTDFNRIIKIGHGEKGEEMIIPQFENDSKIILGFGVFASKKRVTSIYFYFTDKEKYYNIFNPCLLQIRAKLIKNQEFRENVEKRKNELNKKNKLLVDVCGLPNPIFYSIASYFSSY